MYTREVNIKVDSCIYNNTSIIIALVRKEYPMSYMKSFLEWHGYFYSKEEITNFIATDFFKKRMKDFLKEVSATPKKPLQKAWPKKSTEVLIPRITLIINSFELSNKSSKDFASLLLRPHEPPTFLKYSHCKDGALLLLGRSFPYSQAKLLMRILLFIVSFIILALRIILIKKRVKKGRLLLVMTSRLTIV